MTVQVNIALLKKHKETGNQQAFYKLLDEFMPRLRKLIHHKLRKMELQGLVPKNMYSAQGLTDEVFLKIYEEYHDMLQDPDKLKIKMYAVAREILNGLVNKNVANRLSVEVLIKEELRDLDESYTVDADGELILMEELDDISYHQDEYRDDKIILLDEAQIDQIAESFDMDKTKLSKSGIKKIGKVYSDLPNLSQSIVDHYVFAGLTAVQIAEVHNLPAEDVQNVLDKVKNRLNENL